MEKVEKTRVTIYLIKSSFKDFNEIIEDNNDVLEINQNDENTKIFYRKSNEFKPKWLISFFEHTGESEENKELDNINTENAKVILMKRIQFDDGSYRIFAMPFGYGKSMLKKDVYEEQFGLKIVLNTIENNTIKSLSKTDIGTNYKKSKEQMPKASTIYDFDFDVSMELIKEVTAKSGDEFDGVVINGNDGFNFATDKNINNIDELLKKLYSLYISSEYKKHFAWLDNIKLVKSKELINELNKTVVSLLNDRQFNKIWLAIPEIIDWPSIKGIKISGDKNIYDDIDCEAFLNSFIDSKIIDFGQIENKEIATISNENNDKIKSWKASSCLVGSIIYKGNTYSIDNGKWYKVNEKFEKEINDYYDNNISVSSIELIECPEFYDETKYNQILTNSLKNSKMLHETKISIGGGQGNNIEPCDIIANHQLIFIKKNGGSSQLSHLFNQAAVSSRAFKDKEFRNKLRKKVGEDVIEPEDNFASNNYTITLGIIDDREEPKPHIPFFSKVTIKNASKLIEDLGYKFNVKNIRTVVHNEHKKVNEIIKELKKSENMKSEFINEFKITYNDDLTNIDAYTKKIGITVDDYLSEVFEKYGNNVKNI